MDQVLRVEGSPPRPWASRSLRLARLAAPHRLVMLAILVLAAFLDLWHLSQNGWANTYYSAAVRSMTHSWHNFFFASFDPAGLVSVDKPPLSLWVQALSAKLFGFSSFSVLLPEALAGVAAVWVLYLLVARCCGRVAGLVAALALATSPVSVATNRDNNPDALLALLLVLTAYFAVRAAESGRLRWLLGSAAMAGLAFNAKTLVALVVVPGAALAYLLFAPTRWRTRLLQLAAAAAVLGVVSGAWIAAVDLTPAADRPYVSGASDNSELTLTLDYNGFGRVDGQSQGPGGFGGRGPGGTFSSGSPGTLRLIDDALGDQTGWLLPLALVGGLSALLAAGLARRRRELAGLCMLGCWFVAAAGVFSYSSGIIHTYYMSSLAPATAGLFGAGVVALWRDARRGRLWLSLPLAAIALTAWLEVSILRRSAYQTWIQDVVIAVASVAGALLIALVLPSGWARLRRWTGSTRLRSFAAAGALGAVTLGFSIAPAAWAETTLESPTNGTLPGAGPNFVGADAGFGPGGFGGFGGGRFGPGRFGPRPGSGGGPPPGRGFGGFGPGGDANIEAEVAYAKSHGGTGPITLLVSSVMEASSSVIQGERVSAMSGFSGGTLLTPARLAKLVRSGDARYVLTGGFGGFGGFGRGGFGGGSAAGSQTLSVIESACSQVQSSGFQGSGLYDCGGRAAAIESAAP